MVKIIRIAQWSVVPEDVTDVFQRLFEVLLCQRGSPLEVLPGQIGKIPYRPTQLSLLIRIVLFGAVFRPQPFD